MGVILSEERNSEFLTLPHWHSPSHLTCRLRGLLYYLQSKICPQTSWDFAVVQGIQILYCMLKSKIWHTFARFRAPKYSIQTFFSHLVSTKLGTQKTLSMVPIFYTFFMGFYMTEHFLFLIIDEKLVTIHRGSQILNNVHSVQLYIQNLKSVDITVLYIKTDGNIFVV